MHPLVKHIFSNKSFSLESFLSEVLWQNTGSMRQSYWINQQEK